MSKSVKKSYPVMNMSCYSCAVRIESTLKSKAGVISANVNYAAALVNIEFLPALVQVQELKNALTSLGYDLIVAENDD